MRVKRPLIGGLTALLVTGSAAPALAQGQGGFGGDSVRVPCSTTALINAINTANTRNDTRLILARGCTYTLTSAAGGDNGLPPVLKRISIDGNNATVQRDSAAPAFRIFEVDGPGGNLSLSDLTVSGGQLTSIGQYGAGLFVQAGAKLQLVGTTVSGNSVADSGGGIGNAGSTTLTRSTVTGNSAGLNGGGVYSVGRLTIEKNSRLTSNQAGRNGGALHMQGGTASIAFSTLDRNTAASGGAAENIFGTLEIADSVISGNSASTTSGAVDVLDKVILRRTRVEGNTATDDGGAFDNGGQLDIEDSKILNNTSGTIGGAISNKFVLLVRNSQITGNQAQGQGGGVFNSDNAELIHTTVSGNKLLGTAAQGAGLWNEETLTLEDVDVTRNRATDAASLGGGVYNTGLDNRSGNLQLKSTRITDNTAGDAGGVWTDQQFRVFRDSTIRNNHPTNCVGSPITVNFCTG